MGDAANTGGKEGGPAINAGGGKIATAVCGSEEIGALNGCKKAPFGERGGLHFREEGSFNLARFKRGAGAGLGFRSGFEVTTCAFVDGLPAGC